MDLGCYPVHWCRSLLRTEPTIIAAKALWDKGGCEEEVEATLAFPSGAVATIETKMTAGWSYHARFVVEGERGSVVAENSLLPHLGHSIVARLDGTLRQYTLAGDTTFDYQLAAFLEALENGTPLPTEGADPVGNMAAIDAIYSHLSAQRERV